MLFVTRHVNFSLDSVTRCCFQDHQKWSLAGKTLEIERHFEAFKELVILKIIGSHELRILDHSNTIYVTIVN